MPVVFVTKMENGKRTSEGYCLKCAREAGIPVNRMLDDIVSKMGISPEQLESMEDAVDNMITPSDQDDLEEGGAPAVDLPKLFDDLGLNGNEAAPDTSRTPFDTASVPTVVLTRFEKLCT